VTGASRGNGRAVGERLAELGINVIGTSRNPARVPSPPAFPLLQLDVSDPVSVATFPACPSTTAALRRRGAVDILANNGGRLVLGRIVPQSPANLSSMSPSATWRSAPSTPGT
jgi:NAD(P)-dependent dehydrogenase (short-subunit alcohol dehydrogenase family)